MTSSDHGGGRFASDHLKWTLRRLLKRGGWVVRKQPTLSDFLESRAVDLVVDVGANSGQFGRELRAWGYSAGILSFEPGSNAFANLVFASRGDPLWASRNEALGAHIGTAALNITRSTVFSSFLSQSAATEAYGSGVDVIGTEQVPVTTLDNVLCGCAENRIFIKIDTQGFEREVLAGLTDVRRVVGLQLELPAAQLYEGNWTLPQALEAVTAKGFQLAQAEPVGYLKSDPVSATEFDCVFRRS